MIVLMRLEQIQHHRETKQAGFLELTQNISDMVNDIGAYIDKNIETRIKKIETQINNPLSS
jgi:hypothetical protein